MNPNWQECVKWAHAQAVETGRRHRVRSEGGSRPYLFRASPINAGWGAVSMCALVDRKHHEPRARPT